MNKPTTPSPNTPKPASAPTPQPSPDAKCDVCAGPTYELHCKIICRNCGYMRDCSDL